jgi:hypothetical protein
VLSGCVLYLDNNKVEPVTTLQFTAHDEDNSDNQIRHIHPTNKRECIYYGKEAQEPKKFRVF